MTKERMFWIIQRSLRNLQLYSEAISDYFTMNGALHPQASKWVPFLGFIQLQPHKALGLHRLVAMDVKQTCTG